MRCKICHEAIVAVDVMPRTIAVTGTVKNWDYEPDIQDDDEYESSVTVGFGCINVRCANWKGSVGNVVTDDGGKTFRIDHATDLADVAENGTPRR